MLLFWLCWVCCVSCVVCCFVRSLHFPPHLSSPHTTARELQTCTFQGPCASTTPKFHERTPKREKKERKLWRGGKKKARNFGPRTLRGPTLRGPPFGAPPFGAPPFGAHLSGFGPPTLGPPTLRGPIPEAGPHPSPTILGLGSCFFFPVCQFLFCPNVVFFCPVCHFLFCP